LLKILNWEYSIVNFNPTDKIFKLDNDRKIYNITWNVFSIEYTERLNLENDIKVFDELFVAKWYFSEKLDNWMQIPETYWNFEYNWKYYLILNARNKTINEISDISFNWVVLNPSKYLKIRQSVEETSWKVDKIL
jgi:hypothetical protein